MVSAPTARASGRSGTRLDLAVLAVASVALRIPAFVAGRHVTFDDGVFGASAVAMRVGGQPFRDVFSSQGPLFLPLLWLGDLLGFRTTNSPRVIAVVAGVALAVGVYLTGRLVADRVGALLAAALTTACASVLWVSGPIAADSVALAFAVATVFLALRWRDDVTLRRGIVLGLGISATISVKALLAPVIVPVALVMLAGRRLGPILAGAATAVGVHLLLWLPWGPGDVWEQSYGYHLEVAGDRTPGANLAKIASTLGDRDLPLLVALGLALVAIVGRRRAREPWASPRLLAPDTLLLAWLATTVLVLLTEHPMWRPHVSQLVPPLALLAARHRPSTRVLLVAMALTIPYHLVHAWPILQPSEYADASKEAVQLLRSLPEGALAISDDPGIVWRAGRRTPPDLVDASILRIETGGITAASIAAAADQPDVCAVVVRSRARWGSFVDLPRRLTAVGYEVAAGNGRSQRVYVAPDCDPP
ncbi:MAG: glycosyltransferase family 39 protein [Acidimicrobiales bacterium]|nr:glycosyltransferase family 39 protein [Acidimicrobiales bacterium]